MSVSWNPWHGCRKISEGCRNCYVYRQDSRHDKDSREVRQTAMFDRPVRRSRDGRFKVPAGEMVYTCFTSDFLLEEADAWRAEAWEMMRIRHDLRFLFFTKRIDRDVYKRQFLDVEQQAGGVHIAAREGIDIKRLDKGAVIFNTEREEGFAVFVVDNTNRTEARYWIDDFLRVRQRQDNYHNCLLYTSMPCDSILASATT